MATRVPAAPMDSPTHRGGPLGAAADAVVRRPLRSRLVEPSALAAPLAACAPLLVGLDAAAAALDLAPRSVRRLATSGELAYCRIGRLLKFEPSSLAAFVARSRVGSRP
jgi:hypothetical protein